MDFEGGVDGVILVDPQPCEVSAVLLGLEERERLGGGATLIAGQASSPGIHALLEQHPFDGFLDLSWPEALAATTIQTALRHVEARHVIALQRVVIEQARGLSTSLYELANHDGLTNLFNHRYFAEQMERRHEHSQRAGEAYAMVFVDLDDLRQLNTRYGHAGGSQALHELAGIIASSIRGTDVAVRVGGDEFAIFLPGRDQAAGTAFASRLCARLRGHHFAVDDQDVSITVSCGVSSYPEDSSRYADLLKHADSALFHAKALGKNRAVGFESSQESSSLTH